MRDRENNVQRNPLHAVVLLYQTNYFRLMISYYRLAPVDVKKAAVKPTDEKWHITDNDENSSDIDEILRENLELDSELDPSLLEYEDKNDDDEVSELSLPDDELPKTPEIGPPMTPPPSPINCYKPGANAQEEETPMVEHLPPSESETPRVKFTHKIPSSKKDLEAYDITRPLWESQRTPFMSAVVPIADQNEREGMFNEFLKNIKIHSQHAEIPSLRANKHMGVNLVRYRNAFNSKLINEETSEEDDEARYQMLKETFLIRFMHNSLAGLDSMDVTIIFPHEYTWKENEKHLFIPSLLPEKPPGRLRNWLREKNFEVSIYPCIEYGSPIPATIKEYKLWKLCVRMNCLSKAKVPRPPLRRNPVPHQSHVPRRKESIIRDERSNLSSRQPKQPTRLTRSNRKQPRPYPKTSGGVRTTTRNNPDQITITRSLDRPRSFQRRRYP